MKNIIKKGMVKMYKIISYIVTGLLGVAILLMVLFGTYTVNTGEVAIISRFGKVISVEKEGMKFKIPIIDKKTKLEIRDRLIKGVYSVSSEDLQTVSTEVSVQYKIIDPLKVFKSFKNEYDTRLVNPRISEIVQAISSNYTIEELVAKRQQLGQDIYTTLKNDLLPYGIEVQKVSIINHDFSDSFEEAIEQKKSAEQLAQKEEIENRQRIKNAETNLKVKELEAKANSILTETLTDKVLKKQMIDKWNGEMPKVVGKDNVLLNIE